MKFTIYEKKIPMGGDFINLIEVNQSVPCGIGVPVQNIEPYWSGEKLSDLRRKVSVWVPFSFIAELEPMIEYFCKKKKVNREDVIFGKTETNISGEKLCRVKMVKSTAKRKDTPPQKTCEFFVNTLYFWKVLSGKVKYYVHLVYCKIGASNINSNKHLAEFKHPYEPPIYEIAKIKQKYQSMIGLRKNIPKTKLNIVV